MKRTLALLAHLLDFSSALDAWSTRELSATEFRSSYT